MNLTTPLATPPSYPPLFNSETSAPEPVAREKRGIADTSRRWPDGELTVALDLADRKSTALVLDAITEWAHHIPGLRLQIVSGKKGDIRISDSAERQGNWSSVGTAAKKVPLHAPTLHVDRNEDSKEFRQTVLHEFGHALGLTHEHQHPENDINWKKGFIYKGYEGPGVDRGVIYNNFFALPTGSQLLVKNYDPKSVMHYMIDPDLTKDARGVPENYTLSKGDKEIIRTLYTPGRFQGTEPTPAQ